MSATPRLHFILARNAQVGVIFRRGPSKWVQLVRWDTRTDSFEAGQWLHGRIYEKRCDLSPDGTKLVYAARHEHRTASSSAGETPAWTAISRPPYLTAIAIWPQTAMDRGGGLFLDDSRICLDLAPNYRPAPEGLTPPGKIRVELCGYEGRAGLSPHCRMEYLLCRRLARDGWKLGQVWRGVEKQIGYTTESPEVWEKPHRDSPVGLVMTWSATGVAFSYQFFIERADVRTWLQDADWADWDHRGRLVYTAGGKLFACELATEGQLTTLELADFSESTPEPLEAPDWATTWEAPNLRS